MPPDAPGKIEILRHLPKTNEKHGRSVNDKERGCRVNTSGHERKRVKLESLKGNLEKSHDTHNSNAPSQEVAHGLRIAGSSTNLTFYPAYCHSVSPTWFTWVKLTAVDIHRTLQIRDGYQHTLQVGYRPRRNVPMVLFFLNHPIQFVQVVGIVVNLEAYFEKFWLFTIDDSSGATIDVICNKPTAIDNNANISGPAVSKFVQKNHDNTEDDEEKELASLNTQIIENVHIGTVLQVKGTVTQFQRHKHSVILNDLGRQTRALHGSVAGPQQSSSVDRPIRQINLTRLQVVPSTAHELALTDARLQFYASVLSKPWVLSTERVRRLRRKALGETEQVRKKTERHARKRVHMAEEEERDALLIQKEYEQDELRRCYEAEIAKTAGEEFARHNQHQNQNTISGSRVVSMEVDEKTALLRAAFGFA